MVPEVFVQLSLFYRFCIYIFIGLVYSKVLVPTPGTPFLLLFRNNHGLTSTNGIRIQTKLFSVTICFFPS